MTSRKRGLLIAVALVLLGLVVVEAHQWWPQEPSPGTVLDEARRANRLVASFPAADEDYFRSMDQGRMG